MKLLQYDKQKGVGLIEVLITMVVIAVGLLAVASLQSTLMSSSGESKIRAEAMALANEKIEELRNNIEVGGAGYVGEHVAGTFNDTFTGVNAEFTRTWNIIDTGAFADPDCPDPSVADPNCEDPATFPYRKKISVLVGWDANANGQSGATDDERVVVVSEMAWVSPSKSAAYATASGIGTGTPLGPRQNASEDAKENVIGTDLSITDLDTGTAGTSGVDAQVQITDPGGTVIILSWIADGSHFYTATNAVFSDIEAGVIAVFLCSDADNNPATDDTCTHIQNHFGGVVLSHRGTVYSNSGNGLGDIRVAWTSSEINACFNDAAVSGIPFDRMAYECVFAGNCDAMPDAERTRTATGAASTNPGCFVQSVVSDAQILARNVGPGGEFGDVGLLGVDDVGLGASNREEMCFLEDTTLPTTPDTFITVSGQLKSLNHDFILPVTKRLYVSRRIKDAPSSTFEQTSEGINRGYQGHNFLLIERDNTNTGAGSCHQIAVDNDIGLAPRAITRIYSENATNNNIVLPELTQDYNYLDFLNTIGGGAVVIYGSITSAAADLRLYIEERGSCYVNDTSTAYACVTAPYVRSNYTSFDQTESIQQLDFVIDSAPNFDGEFEKSINNVVVATGFTNNIRGGSLTHADSGASFASCTAGPLNPANQRGRVPANITTPDQNCVWPGRF